MTDRRYITFHADDRRGQPGHVHVVVTAGGDIEHYTDSRPAVGSLVLTPADWDALKDALSRGDDTEHHVTVEEVVYE